MWNAEFFLSYPVCCVLAKLLDFVGNAVSSSEVSESKINGRKKMKIYVYIVQH
jgi:hypothetical protein